jgi:hypothetical protein
MPAAQAGLIDLPYWTFGGWPNQGPSPKVRLMEIATGRECRLLYGHRPAATEIGRGPWSVSYSPDGRLLAAPGDDGVQLWEAASGREIAYLPIGVTFAGG